MVGIKQVGLAKTEGVKSERIPKKTRQPIIYLSPCVTSLVHDKNWGIVD